VAGAVTVALLLPAAGCASMRASMRAAWRGEHYTVSLLQVADGRFAQERLVAVLPPGGTPVKCRIIPLFTTQEIMAAEKVMEGKTLTGLRLFLSPESRMRLMQVRAEVREGAVAVMADGCSCAALCPVTTETFAEPGAILLKGEWDPVLADRIADYAETNYLRLNK
jgi:hypothetical protein